MEALKQHVPKVLTWKLMDAPAKRNATYADLDGIPENKVGELIDGHLYIHSRPRIRHAKAITKLLFQLAPADEDPSKKGWIIYPEVEVWIGKSRKNLFVPDLAGWRRSRVPDETAFVEVQTIDLIPDWVCEGLSPSTTHIDRGRKRELYAKHGVKHLWYADPERREVEMLSLQRGGYRLEHVGTTERGVFAPFSHAINLAKLW